MTIEVDGKSYQTDEEGHLIDLSDWSEQLASEMARADGLELDENHREVISCLREYYAKYQVVPSMRILTQSMARRIGREKGNSKYLYQLFPHGPTKQASKYAGLPKPTGCV